MPQVPLWESEEMYKRSLRVLIDNSNIRQSALLHLNQDTAAEALKKVIDTVDPSETLKILGIGSGPGDRDLLILPTIGEYFTSKKGKKPALQNVIVEPSSCLLDEFKAKVSSLPPLLQQITESISFEWHQKTFREFHEETAEKNRFQLIHFYHSIYYLDVEYALRSCFEEHLTTDSGVILCLVQAEDSYFALVSHKFKGKLSCGSEDMAFRTDQELVAIAEKHGWKYSVPLKEQFEINVTSCLAEEPTERGDLLIDFLTQQQNFRATAEPDLYHSVIEFIDSLTFTKENGDKFVQGRSAAVIIYKW